MTSDPALTPFFRPASIAVVGAGERPTSSGGAVLRNLLRSGFAGRIVPVNPKGGPIAGLAAAPSLAAVAPPCDLAVIVIRPDLIPDTVRDAAASGHRNLLILPSGFAEAGPEGAARDAEVRAIAAEAGLTVAGPNCAGILHLDPAAPMAASFLRDLPPGPSPATGKGLALISQSGALAEELIARANDRRDRGAGLPLTSVVSVGNALHLGVADYLAALGERPEIGAILLYVEAIPDPDRFRAAARRVSAEKPVVALIGGRSGPGARAVAAHTGGTVMDDAAAEAFCRDCGILRVTSLRRLLLAARGFGAFPRGFGPRVLILSNSGGPGVLATDRAAAEGLELPTLPPAMTARLRSALPAEASVANPVDLLADAREDRFGEALVAAAEAGSAAFDAVLMIHVVPFMVDAAPVIARLAEQAPTVGLPVMHSMMGTLEDRPGWFAAMEAAGVPMFDDPESMAECAGLLARYAALSKAVADG